ncbi:MAG: sugar phosphate isomerase/epimerase [candidate division Zixibacteria bacterium]|nr:sugar phosphate isomerase/epimerase [candidate division Zixibacteria bacterium]
MKIGVNLWIWGAPFRTDRHLGLLAKARSMGAETVEFAMEEETVMDTVLMCRALTDEGLECSVVGLFGPPHDLSLHDMSRRAGVEYAKRCIDVTAEIGASVFSGAVVGVGGHEPISPNDYQTRIKHAAESLHTLGVHAQKAGVRMVVEALNRYESHFVNTAAEARVLVDAADHEAIGVHLDTFHMGIEEDHLGDAIRRAGDKLMHIHVSESHRGTPGTGLTPWDQVAQGLRDIGYEGHAVIESVDHTSWLGPLACIWRPLAPSGDDLARNGLQFLRKRLR